MSNNLKENCWKKITEQFNAKFLTEKNWEQLRDKWLNQKKMAKKLARDERVETMKTGGGQKVIESANPIDERVHGMIQESINPLKNPYDSDKIADLSVKDANNESSLMEIQEENPAKKSKREKAQPKEVILNLRKDEHKIMFEKHEMLKEKHAREGLIHELTVKKMNLEIKKLEMEIKEKEDLAKSYSNVESTYFFQQ